MMDARREFLKKASMLGGGTSLWNSLSAFIQSENILESVPVIWLPLLQGFENFNQYIKDSAVVILDSAGQRLTANILLSFRLNKKGYFRDIEVIESSCKACESEAVRLLKNGPAWKGSSGAKGNVRIQF